MVALTDQWYLKYGETEWQEATRQVLSLLRSALTTHFLV